MSKVLERQILNYARENGKTIEQVIEEGMRFYMVVQQQGQRNRLHASALSRQNNGKNFNQDSRQKRIASVLIY